MCTVSWLQRSDGYTLLSNRDERRTRARAEPPEIREQEGVAYIAPTDPDGGGTWISVNAVGLTLTLLNDDDAGGTHERAWTSRGVLVRRLAHRTDVSDVARALRGQSLEDFRGFRLVALGVAQAPEVFEWNRRELTRRALGRTDLPLASSSFSDRDEIVAARSAAWGKIVSPGEEASVEELLAFHRSRYPRPGPSAVCMERENAATVSASWIEVERDVVRLRYCAGAPCDGEFGSALQMRRVR